VEASIAARYAPTSPSGNLQSGSIIVPSANLAIYGRATIKTSNITVDFSGSIIQCYMQDTCIWVGDPVSSNNVSDVTLINPRGQPQVVNGTYPFITVEAQKNPHLQRDDADEQHWWHLRQLCGRARRPVFHPRRDWIACTESFTS
jgi:hypothetical protein